MMFRVLRRRAFGRKAGATLRSVYPVVLGLGGWFVGALIVLTTMPGVPLDNELLAVLSIGVPVGLGIYLAWVRVDWPAQIRRVGLAAAVASAIVGAWLGFNTITGMLAILTTIAGAAAGANAILLAYDIAREGRVGARAAAASRATFPMERGSAA